MHDSTKNKIECEKKTILYFIPLFLLIIIFFSHKCLIKNFSYDISSFIAKMFFFNKMGLQILKREIGTKDTSLFFNSYNI